jgi:hypothetical protein
MLMVVYAECHYAECLNYSRILHHFLKFLLYANVVLTL